MSKETITDRASLEATIGRLSKDETRKISFTRLTSPDLPPDTFKYRVDVQNRVGSLRNFHFFVFLRHYEELKGEDTLGAYLPIKAYEVLDATIKYKVDELNRWWKVTAIASQLEVGLSVDDVVTLFYQVPLSTSSRRNLLSAMNEIIESAPSFEAKCREYLP